MALYILDTDILSYVLGKNPDVVSALKHTLSNNDTVILCPVVSYEIRRGLLHKDASNKLEFFEQLVATLVWDDLQRVDWETASQIWADCERNGQHSNDADILIASHAIRHGAKVVTNNLTHFAHLGVQLENWRDT